MFARTFGVVNAPRAISVGLLTWAATFLSASDSVAQQRTFYLDRLKMGGAPDDGLAVFRPVVSPKLRFFGQMGLGLTIDPLRLRTVAPNQSVLRTLEGNPVSGQLIDYMTVGTELAGRLALLATLPVSLYQGGTDPSGSGITNGLSLHSVAAHDMRFDARLNVFRSDDRKWNLGVGLSLYAPTGDAYSFAGDTSTSTALNVAAETYIRDFILTGNLGVHLRPDNSVGALAVGNELTFAAGAFLPLRDGKLRIGAELFGSTGIQKLGNHYGTPTATFFSAKNTPLEWMAEGRVMLDPSHRWWAGGSLGTRLDAAYGAPDLRLLAAMGYWFNIADSDPSSPAERMKMVRAKIAREGGDADHDGIPDDVDLCPTVAEDKLEPDPTDGCPKPPDRDNDGIPDDADKCPDQPEDKDGIDDLDGCPEDDFDRDGVPDVTDACPREPGQPSPDPKQNGCPQFIKRVTGSTEIQILKQVQFDTGKSTIKQASFAMLDEIVKLLQANTDIQRLSIEGHTDNRGAVEMNNKLSQDRADSVMHYVSSHGVGADRLEAHGFGPSRPIDSNDTDAGRQKNRRVEFHITQQSASGAPEKN